MIQIMLSIYNVDIYVHDLEHVPSFFRIRQSHGIFRISLSDPNPLRSKML